MRQAALASAAPAATTGGAAPTATATAIAAAATAAAAALSVAAAHRLPRRVPLCQERHLPGWRAQVQRRLVRIRHRLHRLRAAKPAPALAAAAAAAASSGAAATDRSAQPPKALAAAAATAAAAAAATTRDALDFVWGDLGRAPELRRTGTRQLGRPHRRHRRQCR